MNTLQEVLESEIAERRRFQLEHSDMLVSHIVPHKPMLQHPQLLKIIAAHFKTAVVGSITESICMTVVAMQAARAAREREVRVVTLQAALRGWLVRRTSAPQLQAVRVGRQRQVQALQLVVVQLQACARGWLVRQAVAHPLWERRARRERLWKGVVWIQAHIRGLLVRRDCIDQLRTRRVRRKLEALATPLQAHCRGYLVRKQCLQNLVAYKKQKLRFEGGVVRFQAHSRGYIIRRKYSQKLRGKRMKQQSRQRPDPSTTDTHSGTIYSPTHSDAAVATPVIPNPCNARTPVRVTVASSNAASPLRSTTSVATHSSSADIPVSPCRTTATTPRHSESPIASITANSEGPVEICKHISMSARTTSAPTVGTAARTTSAPTAGTAASTTSAPTAGTAASTTSAPAVASSAMVPSSPTKRKLTVERRLLSSLKVLSASLTNTSDTTGTSRYTPSELRTCSSPSLTVGVRNSEEKQVEEGAGREDEGEDAAVDEAVAAEAKALQEVVRSREEEKAVAQLARERMSAIFSAEEIQLIAERQRKRGSYQKELESACSPLLPVAWLGLVEERLEWWKQKHAQKNKRGLKKQPAEDSSAPMEAEQAPSPAVCGHQSLSKAQLLAASRRGSKLEDVVQVVLYRSRHSPDLSSLQQCPKLRTITLSKCGLEVLTGLEHCPLLTEINAPVCTQSLLES